MQRIRVCSALPAVVIGVLLSEGHVRAQDAAPTGTLYEMSLPGGLRGALAAIDDRVAPDRSQFLLELIRRTHNSPIIGKADPRDGEVRALIAHLDLAIRQPVASAAPLDTLPLPLSPATWTGVVFGGRVPSPSLAAAILQSRNAALLYYGLLSLDDETRAWLATQPALLGEIASRGTAAFVLAAPALRVSGSVVRVPGGDLAGPAWQAVVGRRTSEPAEFVRALVAQEDGRLAYFFGAMADLTSGQIGLALSLESSSVDDRVAAARRLHAVFERAAGGWRADERVFGRPIRDPALLVADLAADGQGRPVLPGTRRFWSAVFADIESGRRGENEGQGLAEGEPVDFAWLCDQVFARDPGEQRRRSDLVLFASRVVRRVTPETALDAVDAVRGAGRYPALIAVLERAGVVDLAALAGASRRASRLSAIGDETRAIRAIEQFQGVLALVTRAALRGSLAVPSVTKLVTSLSAVDFSERGDYDGALARWLGAWADRQIPAQPEPPGAPLQSPADGVERFALRLLAGPAATEPRFVDWEGTRYRLDLPLAESIRLTRLLGDHPRPYLSSARALVAIADDLGDAGPTPDRLLRAASGVERVAEGVVPGGEPSAARAFDASASMLRRMARDADARGNERAAPALRTLADDLLACGLRELAYAAALGQPDRASFSLAEVARRHDFGLLPGGIGRSTAWRRPLPDASTFRGWRIVGSLLGLDVALAELSLTRVSMKAIPRKPSLTSEDRRVAIEAVALVEPAALTDADRDAIAAAMTRGRARVAALRTPREAAQVAVEIRLGPIRRTLLPWVVAHDSARARFFLSPSELLWLGLEQKPVAAAFHAWGAPGEPRVGCLCLQLFDRRPWDALAGRWHAGILGSSFPELNLRLGELLAELRMPAALLGAVLASATFDFVNTAASQDEDDRRGLVEFVHALGPARVEEYLAMLTTDGPLVPVSGTPEPLPATGPRVPR